MKDLLSLIIIPFILPIYYWLIKSEKRLTRIETKLGINCKKKK